MKEVYSTCKRTKRSVAILFHTVRTEGEIEHRKRERLGYFEQLSADCCKNKTKVSQNKG